ncbi:MAG: phosphoribosylformylglycinamidine synthase, partial [Saprospiraceae bacterium]|nr:phosphoribosylformylglycinamidine synthase [Saprospiraceae bacterium]
GKVAKQQCVGPLQLPLNDCAVVALDYDGQDGIATSMGHAPLSGLISSPAGSRNAVAEALTNVIWAPLQKGIGSVSLSANWMWPCNNPGEDARLYEAVEALSDFAITLGINVPTGKDSLSMKQKYADQEVLAPGSVVVSAVGHCADINRVVEPVLQKDGGPLYYINFSNDQYALGGSSLAQTLNKIGAKSPDIVNTARFVSAFDTIQDLIKDGKILAGHDVSAGGILTCLLEMCFSDIDLAAEIDLTPLQENDLVKLLFAENAGIIFQAVDQSVEEYFDRTAVSYAKIGEVVSGDKLVIKHHGADYNFPIPKLRDVWFETSFLLDRKQTAGTLARERFAGYKEQPLKFVFPSTHSGMVPVTSKDVSRPIAAVIREKGSNSERELANALYLAGFAVKDVHMTDLMEGREDLSEVRFLGAVGGFSNSDVLGSAKGWAGAFKYNERANKVISDFFARTDVLSIGICNGCQLFIELDLINPVHDLKAYMDFNDSMKHESSFTSVKIPKNNSVMLSTLAGTKLGVWISHGEGKFNLPLSEDQYNIVAKYGYASYPANPNGSHYNTAMMCDPAGRHLVTMPHIERSIYSWNWAHYPKERGSEVSPWLEAFINAREWIEQH